MLIQNDRMYHSTEESDETHGLLTGMVTYTVQENPKGTSWIATVFLVVNAALGAGLLEFPYAYNAAGGILVSIVVQAVFLVFIVVALLLLVHCSDIHKSNTYQAVVDSISGKKGRISCAFCIMVYCFGTCITFFIIIGDQWDRFFLFVYNDDFCNYWYMNRKFIIPVTSLLFILPLCFSKRIDFLTYASYVGVLGVVYVVVLIIVKYFMMGSSNNIKTSPDSWMDIFTVVPTICFGYQCHVSIVPIYSCMKNRNIKEFSKTISCAILVCVLSYTVAAVFGYWTFGTSVKPDILESYHPDAEVLVALIMIAAKTYTTYPILLFCGRAGLDSLWLEMRPIDPESDTEGAEERRRYIMTVIWFTLSLMLAILIPNIADVIQLLGSLAAVFIFIFPGLCLLQIALPKREIITENRYKWNAALVFGCTFIVIGAFFVGLSTTQALIKDIKGTPKTTLQTTAKTDVCT